MKKFICLLIIMLTFEGCASLTAIKQPDYKNISLFKEDVKRGELIKEFGEPIYSEEKPDGKMEIFSFKQGYSKGNKAIRALFHGAADVYTYGFWELLGTPVEKAANGKNIKVTVVYDKTDVVKKAVFL